MKIVHLLAQKNTRYYSDACNHHGNFYLTENRQYGKITAVTIEFTPQEYRRLFTHKTLGFQHTDFERNLIKFFLDFGQKHPYYQTIHDAHQAYVKQVAWLDVRQEAWERIITFAMEIYPPIWKTLNLPYPSERPLEWSDIDSITEESLPHMRETFPDNTADYVKFAPDATLEQRQALLKPTRPQTGQVVDLLFFEPAKE